MTVRELIEKLQTKNPNLPIKFPECQDDGYGWAADEYIEIGDLAEFDHFVAVCR